MTVLRRPKGAPHRQKGGAVALPQQARIVAPGDEPAGAGEPGMPSTVVALSDGTEPARAATRCWFSRRVARRRLRLTSQASVRVDRHCHPHKTMTFNIKHTVPTLPPDRPFSFR